MVHILKLICFFLTLLLTSCAFFSCNNCSQGRYDLLTECWMDRINTNPNLWLRYADPWFLNGCPNPTEIMNKKAPACAATTFMKVRAPFFDKVFVDGSFQVQIMGNQPYTSVTILGPNQLTRFVSVDYGNNAINLRQIKIPKIRCQPNLDKVIIRIGIGQLHDITNKGCGHIYGRCISSDRMGISVCGSGKIMLVGNMNIQRIRHIGSGTITLIGAYAPCLSIYVIGPGSVNLMGRVGVQTIQHTGNGIINIIGADSDGLCINTDGCGLTTLCGSVNLTKVVAKGSSQVYLNCVTSQSTCVAAFGCARVGIAGTTHDLRVTLGGGSKFLGSYFRSGNAFIHTYGSSHANVTAGAKLFSSAENTSSIYFYGSPGIAATNLKDQGTMVMLAQVPPVSKGFPL